MPVKPAVLLTGGTGQVGRHLLRDLLLSGRRVGVLARPSGGMTADERVAQLLDFCSASLGRVLPAPVVLTGDLGAPRLGLSAGDRRWLSRNCSAVIHAAASTSFRAATEGEPWQTNRAGTETLVRLAQELGLGDFNYISTAFVCGRRRGLILESELDCGQGFRNAYEESKLAAERLVRAASGLRVRIYRPSVIVGDARTGYTSSYLGLYWLCALAARLAAPGKAGSSTRRLPLRLPLSGDETCSLVPVDWVSRAIVELHARADSAGKTYHLVARAPTPVAVIHAVATEELRLDGVELAGSDWPADASNIEELFRAGIADYAPYLHGTPHFDDRATMAALPQLPPPCVDAALLRRLIRFAIADDWGRRTPSRLPVGHASDCAAYFEETFPTQARASDLARSVGLDLGVGFDISGAGGGQWSCRWAKGEFIDVQRGLHDAALIYHTNVPTFHDVLQGRTTPHTAFFDQRIGITGDVETALKLATLFEEFLRDQPPSARRPREAIDAGHS